MLLQAALAAMIVSTGVVVIEMRRIDDRHAYQQDRMNQRLNLTADQLDRMHNDNLNMREINRVLHEDVNNLHSTIENHSKEIELYKGKSKEEE